MIIWSRDRKKESAHVLELRSMPLYHLSESSTSSTRSPLANESWFALVDSRSALATRVTVGIVSVSVVAFGGVLGELVSGVLNGDGLVGVPAFGVNGLV